MPQKSTQARTAARFDPQATIDVFAKGTGRGEATVPIHLAENLGDASAAGLTSAQKSWLATQAATGSRIVLIPNAQGQVSAVVARIPKASATDPFARPEVILGTLAQTLPTGRYALATKVADHHLAAVAWGLGRYTFKRYKSGDQSEVQKPQLVMPDGVDEERVAAEVAGVWFGRDLINTPAADLGPAALEAEARALAKHHGALVESIVGDDLIAKRFPMIHAVGRASLDVEGRAPRLVDIRWQPSSRAKGARPKIVIVGKGITFDTGGLDIKPAAAMLLMKKDMGGAATALALAHMVMATGLDVELRVLLPIAENAIAGDAFRPGDVLQTRAGLTVEIGNTDAEGRLVLGDALTYADEAKPDVIMTFATLTGAARVALGPDLPPYYCDDAQLARQIDGTGRAACDPAWHMPFWPGYETHLESGVADIINSAESPFAGSITAALFLKRFVKHARRFAHFDIYGWRPAPKPLGPKGGEPQMARAMFAVISHLSDQARTGS
jgi:leucyl aminopeptidase